MKFIITGKRGSGKTYLANKLENKQMIIDDNNNTDNGINNYEHTDIIIASPDRINQIAEQLPNTAITLVIVRSDDTMRKIFAIKDIEKNKKIQAEEEYDARDKSEQNKFNELDDAIEAFRQNFNTFPENINNVMEFANDYSEQTADSYVDFLMNYKTIHKKLSGIVSDAAKINILETNSNAPDKIKINTQNGSEKFVSNEYMASFFMSNTNEFWNFMLSYITHSDRFKDL